MTDYVLVIHGTWNAPEKDPKDADATNAQARQLKWFELDCSDPDNFCHRLNRELQGSSMEEAVWRACPGVETRFGWSGDNTHQARLDGARKLAQRLWEIRSHDPEARIHLVAHSHGGNVVLKAIDLYFAKLRKQARRVVRAARRNMRDSGPHVPLEEVLTEVCGQRVGQAHELGALASELLLPLLSEANSVQADVTPASFVQQFATRVRQIPLLGAYAPFHNAWERSPQSHRLGRLVFMGTPFYYKRWLPTGRLSTIVRSGKLLLSELVRGIAMVAATYVLMLIIGRLIAVLPSVDFIGLNPLRWNHWLQVVLITVALMGTAMQKFLILSLAIGLLWYAMIVYCAGLLCLLPAIDFVGFNPLTWPLWLKIFSVVAWLAGTVGELLDDPYRNVNIYCSDSLSRDKSWQVGGRERQPPLLEAMVFSAGLLDEALLALSIEPLVYGFLSPELNTFLAPPWFPPIPPARVGVRSNLASDLQQANRKLNRYLLGPIRALMFRLSARWAKPKLTDVILKLASAGGFGLPTQEFSDARITPSPKLEIPELIDSGETVDVKRQLNQASGSATTAGVAETYDFLTSHDTLARKLEDSFTWKKVKPHLHELRIRSGRTDDLYETEVQRLCAIIDVRIREFAGMVELFHSGYYGNEEIIESISLFLRTGRREMPVASGHKVQPDSASEA